MATKEEIKSLIAQKQAGVRRMRDRQRLVHMKMANLVEEHPEVIGEALNRVLIRLENKGAASREIYVKWYEILETWPARRIANILRDDSLEYEQLRACAPFDFTKKSVAKEVVR